MYSLLRVQTGSGKTYTIEGTRDPANRGVIPRAADEIFGHIADAPSGPNTPTYLVRCTFFQIYKEHITDLLASSSGTRGGGGRGGAPTSPRRDSAKSSSLPVREDATGEPYVFPLREVMAGFVTSSS